jgi:hypothetical protein
MRERRTYGTTNEIQALTEVLNIRIRVYDSESGLTQEMGGGPQDR